MREDMTLNFEEAKGGQHGGGVKIPQGVSMLFSGRILKDFPSVREAHKVLVKQYGGEDAWASLLSWWYQGMRKTLVWYVCPEHGRMLLKYEGVKRTCPSCGSISTISYYPNGREAAEHEGEKIAKMVEELFQRSRDEKEQDHLEGGESQHSPPEANWLNDVKQDKRSEDNERKRRENKNLG